MKPPLEGVVVADVPTLLTDVIGVRVSENEPVEEMVPVEDAVGSADAPRVPVKVDVADAPSCPDGDGDVVIVNGIIGVPLAVNAMTYVVVGVSVDAGDSGALLLPVGVIVDIERRGDGDSVPVAVGVGVALHVGVPLGLGVTVGVTRGVAAAVRVPEDDAPRLGVERGVGDRDGLVDGVTLLLNDEFGESLCTALALANEEDEAQEDGDSDECRVAVGTALELDEPPELLDGDVSTLKEGNALSDTCTDVDPVPDIRDVEEGVLGFDADTADEELGAALGDGIALGDEKHTVIRTRPLPPCFSAATALFVPPAPTPGT